MASQVACRESSVGETPGPRVEAAEAADAGAARQRPARAQASKNRSMISPPGFDAEFGGIAGARSSAAYPSGAGSAKGRERRGVFLPWGTAEIRW